ncbi:polysaccharide deacetylase family protein [Desulfosarcina variabilis]|uniref:polysaccharide deacetylase family protein n=1 Tax=Desulfosarcina variabilis TaxID=2300 RepID=UPI003AFAC55A
MSDLTIEQPFNPHRHAFVLILCRIISLLFVIFWGGLLSSVFHVVHAEQNREAQGRSLPLLVRARQGDTPASLASRYLNDAAKAWMIVDYNGMVTFDDGQAVLIPTAPFRLGGLTPSGYQSVPVLAYADIDEPSNSTAQLSTAAFDEQMSWLKNSGYTTITPAQLLAFMAFSGQLPKHAVLITADTESSAFFDQAVPVLKSFGFTATLFVATARVGKAGNMTWEQLQKLNHAGFAIGCRGQDGRSLTPGLGRRSLEANFAKIETELRQAKKAVEDHLEDTCTVLAYPQGHTNDLLSAMAAKIGFSLAFVQSEGENPFFANRFAIHRLVIDRRLDPDEFTQMLTTRVAVDLQ